MTCTCALPASQYPTTSHGPDPDCPTHGLQAALDAADQNLDIDEAPACTCNGTWTHAGCPQHGIGAAAHLINEAFAKGGAH